MNGIIYILTNEAMPGYAKIGKTTTSVEQRMRELDTSGVPLPFECFYAARVADCNKAERLLHDAFGDHRVRTRREFFRISPERIASAIKLAAIEEVTPRDDVVEDVEDEAALNLARERRSRFNFDLIGLKAGDMLQHVKDENVVCTVIDNTRVLFQNQPMSLSKAALQALHQMGFTWKAVSGSEYWEFQGRTLDEMRRAIEEAE